MRIVILEDSKKNMASLRRMLAAQIPDIEVSEYDPEQMGKPGIEFDWSLYELAIINEQLCGSESGLAWLSGFKRRSSFPPCLLVTETKSDYVVQQVASMKDVRYVEQRALNPFTIKQTVKELGIDLDDPDRTIQRNGGVRPIDQEIVDALDITQNGLDFAGSEGYRFVRLIGQGAHSRVYLAERSTDNLTLVLKVLDLEEIEEASVISRFEKEAELMWDLRNPYVVRVYDHGFTAKQGYIAMEFFTRGDLKQRIEHGLDSHSALVHAMQIAYGLEAIHVKGIVHRDLKPGNIMFRSDDSLAIADFGISKRIGDAWGLTKTGTILGTLNYLSPEQGLGQEIDERSDLYALGMILFEMLTGQKAFHATSPGALIYQHLHADIPLLPEEYREFQYLIDKTLAKDPNDRFQSASEFVVNLQHHMTSGRQATAG